MISPAICHACLPAAQRCLKTTAMYGAFWILCCLSQQRLLQCAIRKRSLRECLNHLSIFTCQWLLDRYEQSLLKLSRKPLSQTEGQGARGNGGMTSMPTSCGRQLPTSEHLQAPSVGGNEAIVYRFDLLYRVVNYNFF